MRKRLLKVLEKAIWIVVGAALTAVVVGWIESRSPDIVVRQYYNTVDNEASVPTKVGELTIEYRVDEGDSRLRGNDGEDGGSPRPFGPRDDRGVYLVEVVNEGDGPEESVRFQIVSAKDTLKTFFREPNMKVFSPKQMSLTNGEFFADLGSFPIGATAEVAFVPPDDLKELCKVDISVAGNEKMGRVERIKGVKCD